MHRDSPAPFADLRLQDGDMLMIGNLRLQAIHTPGHTRDSMCLLTDDRMFTGDTLFIGQRGAPTFRLANPKRFTKSGGDTS